MSDRSQAIEEYRQMLYQIDCIKSKLKVLEDHLERHKKAIDEDRQGRDVFEI